MRTRLYEVDEIFNTEQRALNELSFWENVDYTLEQGKGCLPHQWRLKIKIKKEVKKNGNKLFRKNY